MSSRTFVIGDIHGCALTLRNLLFKILAVRNSDKIYLLGDLIDRGPRSKEVLDTIIRLQDAGYFIRSVRGNHEEMLLNACSNRSDFSLWIENGGLATLRSFNVEDACEIPLPYRRFLDTLPYYILLDNFVLSHAGINCTASEPFADTVSMLWGRDLPAVPDRVGNRRIVCGHTVHSLPEIYASLESDRIVLDGGCVFKGRGQFGNLVALEMQTLTLHHTPNIDL
ncbi:serine/threonine-protein phosphatase [Geobacter sp. OR-1]|uniref:metallophosphoesterase n=1 Tax=Geobacter sp. OR-1 TaxID=1266765 RepID=UPI0005422352|nr:metallophosphoesterase [Geobacter sp. OR-1]GAM08065.1 serine/threonine-protein phosphatase [Geobacter sp. OR-1]